MLTEFDWGSVFLITLPVAVAALVLAHRLVPAHINETTDPVDNLGGILSVLMIAALVLAINFSAIPNAGALAAGLGLVALAWRPPHSSFASGGYEVPLYDLSVARSADLLGRRGRRDHRLRDVDGRDVHRAAVPAERARSTRLWAQVRRSCPAAVGMVSDGASVGKAHRGAGIAVHPPRRLSLLPARFLDHALPMGREDVVLGGRPCIPS